MNIRHATKDDAQALSAIEAASYPAAEGASAESIHERHRGEGCARKLLERVIADSRVAGRKGIVLTCKERLLPFYAKFGFVDEGISASVHGNVLWHQMRLRLDG